MLYNLKSFKLVKFESKYTYNKLLEVLVVFIVCLIDLKTPLCELLVNF